MAISFCPIQRGDSRVASLLGMTICGHFLGRAWLPPSRSSEMANGSPEVRPPDENLKVASSMVFNTTAPICSKHPDSRIICVAMKSTTHNRRDLFLFAVHFLVPFVIYSFTLLPGTGYRGDTAKFHFLGHILGVPHTTGYPQYLLLNHLVSLLPWQEPAYGQNLLSAVIGAGAVAVLFFILRRLTGDAVVASAATLLFAFSRRFWSQCIVAEVYALQVLFLVGILYCAVRWQREREDRWLVATLFLYAVSFGNHASSIFLLPGFVLFFCLVDCRVFRRKMFWLSCIGFVLLSLSQYAYLFIRTRSECPYIEVPIYTLGDFLRFASGAKFHSRMMGFSWSELWYNQTHWFLSLFYFQFFLPGCIFAILGAWSLLNRNRPLFWLTFPAIILKAIFAAGYRVDDAKVFALPCFFLAVFWIAEGMRVVVERYSLRMARAFLLLLFPILIVSNWQLVDQSENVLPQRVTERIIRFVPQDSVLITEIYQVAHYFRYHLWVKELRRPEEHIYTAQEWEPQELAAYLAGVSPLVECGLEIPVGLNVFFADCPELFSLPKERFEPVLFYDYPDASREAVLYRRVTD